MVARSARLVASLLALHLAWLPAQPAHAQQRGVPLGRGDNVGLILRPGTDQGSGSMLIEPTAPVANLFSRAEDGIARRDWKFAIDSLQRIIDDPEASLYPRFDLPEGGEIIYESARRVAYRRLASLPPEGLHAYRLLHNGKASALFERAKAEHAPALLRSIVNRYLLTGHGDDAAELLASWSLDTGSPADALALLTDITELLPHTDVPPRLIAIKSAAAQMLLGRSEEASAIISQLAIDACSTPGRGPDDQSSPAEGGWATSAILNMRSSTGSLPFYVGHTSWPVFGGSASRQGLMVPVTPTLTRPTPWRFDQPRYASALWRPSVTGDPDDPPAAPPGSLVAANGSVYARNPDGVFALNAHDLSPVWSVGIEQGGTHSTRSELTDRSTAVTRSSRGAPFDEALLADHAAWSVSVAHGLVLTLGRRAASAQTTGSRFAPLRGTRSQPAATRLSAYDAATGELRWERGRGGELADPLGPVEYRALPIAVDDALWVPTRRQRDLSVAVLDPSDGSLIQSVLLGMLPTPSVSLWHSLRPAADDRAVYIPSGHGVLFAVATSDLTLRWASQYAARPCEEETTKTALRRRRLPSPPVVCGGLVLLTPVDRNELLAFSVTDGTVRWSAPVNESSYVIAATSAQSSDLRVWLGGRHLKCLSVPTGETIWTQEVGAVQTGRSVLSGDTLYVPTWEGLISFDADTGARTGGTSVPGSHEPLGNLLCVGSSLFSLSPASVRRFPDVVRAYPEALARYNADPSGVGAAELGWIELLRGNAQRAYEVVRDVDVTAWPREDGRSFGLAHVRVEALLAMADEVADSPSETLHYFEEAARIAGTPEDRLRCGLALARRLSAVGRQAEAYGQFLHVGWGRDGMRLIAVEESVDATARFAVSRDLRSLQPQLDDGERAALSDFVAERVAQAVASLPQPQKRRTAEDALWATVELDPIGAASKTALLALADLRLAQLRYGQAEQLLLGCARRGVDASTTILALMKLYDLYAVPWQDGADAQAAVLDQLVAGFGHLPIPDRAGETVGAWAEEARKQLESVEPAPLALTGELAWPPIFEKQADRDVQRRRQLRQFGQNRNAAPELVDFGGALPTALAHRIVFVDADGVVRCHNVDTGDELWRSPLRFAEEFRDEIRQRATTPVDPQLRLAVAYGQIGVFRAGDALHAIGLASGKRIWIRACDEPGLSHATVAQSGDSIGSAVRRDLSMAVGAGWLIATPRAGRLTMMSLLDGKTIWERDLRGETVDSMRVYEGLGTAESSSSANARIVTLDAKLERVHIFDPADGQLIRRVIFRQPYRDVEEWAHGERINIVEAHAAAADESAPSDTAKEQWHTSNVLCGPTSSPLGDSVLAVDLASGETRWEMLQPKPLTQLLELRGDGLSSSGYIGIVLLGGDFRIVEAATGEVVFDQHIPRLQKVVDAVLYQGTLLVRHVAPNDSATAIRAIDVATGAEVWHRDGLPSMGTATAPLSVVGGRIPLVLDGGLAEGRRWKPLKLAVIDARTGGEIGSVVDLGVTPNDLRGRRGLDLEIRRGVVVVGTPLGIFPFATESAPIPSEGGC